MMPCLMDDEDLVHTVVEDFLEDIPKQIELLKGASAYLGGEALRAVAFEMEKAGKSGDIKAVTAKIPDLEMQFTRLKQAMKEFADDGK